MASLHPFLFAPTDKTPRSRLIFWVALSLTFAAIYPIVALQDAFSGAYVMQDDARQHVFWMLRFLDEDLFPGDLTADYFQSVAPWGYSHLYRVFAWLGVNPFVLNKLLPLPIALISTAYAFGIALQLLPVPLAGFLTAVLLNQSLWMRDDIGSGTPVAFVYPIFLAFLYYLLKRRLFPCLATIVLQGLFYPQCVFIYAGILVLRLVQWREKRVRWSSDRQDYWFCGTGLVTAFFVLLPYALQSSVFGPAITAAEARTLPTFAPGGWSSFYGQGIWNFWICGKRSGMVPFEWCETAYKLPRWFGQAESPILRFRAGLPQVGLALALPVLMRFARRFPLAQQIDRRMILLPQTLLVSLVLFFVAHALLFELHLPNRYSEHSLRIVTALAGGIALTVLLDALVRSIGSAKPSRRWLATGMALFTALALLLYPEYLWFEGAPFPFTNYTNGKHPDLYEFFQQQPKDAVIASIDPEINNIPSFTRRSMVAGGKGYVLPYHLGYYQEVSQRLTDLIQAQYSPDRRLVQQIIQTYGVDFWLLEKSAFKPAYLKNNPVFEEYAPAAKGIRPRLRGNATPPAMLQLARDCQVFQTEEFMVVEAQCILSQQS